MGRAYAGVLGYLAAVLTLARGVWSGGGLEGTLLTMLAVMPLFAAIGFVVGTIAQTTVDQAMREKLEVELAASHPPEVS
jgi:hypothetical protein